MVTLFTTAKPFRGRNATIQCNALKSWTLLHPSVHSFRACWALFRHEDQFLINPPSRLDFFRHVILETYVNSPRQTWKLTKFNFLSVFSALIFGYQRASLLYKWQGSTMNALQSVFGVRVSRGEQHAIFLYTERRVLAISTQSELFQG
jgi:hypothetical protein